MTFKLPDLPYAKDALMPHVSEQTMNFHHDKHHRTYVDKLNAAVKDTDYADMGLMDIIHESHKNGDTGVFNNAAQAWNHEFFWNSMTPSGPLEPSGKLADMIETKFDSLPQLRTEFISEGVARFGSGWVWLVEMPDATLNVVSTPNADLPQLNGMKPLLTCDLWEHAYYLDYQNARQKFLEVWFDNLANWDFAAKCLTAETAQDVLAA